jgi:hypothetical protein
LSKQSAGCLGTNAGRWAFAPGAFFKSGSNRVEEHNRKASRLPPFLAGLLLGAALTALCLGTRAAADRHRLEKKIKKHPSINKIALFQAIVNIFIQKTLFFLKKNSVPEK